MRWLMFCICLCAVGHFASLRNAGAERALAAAEASQEDPPPQPELLTIQQQLRRALEEGTITSRYGALLTEALWSRIKYEAGRERANITGDPNSFKLREAFAKRILGKDLYNGVESHLLKAVQSSPEPDAVQVALRVLGRGLASSRAQPILRLTVDEAIKRARDDDATNDPNPSTLFYLAEALAYMGDGSGLDVPRYTLESNTMPEGTICAVIRALTALATLEAKTLLLSGAENLRLSESGPVASCAFEHLRFFDDTEAVVRQAACKQLDRLAKIERDSLHEQERVLLLKTCLILREQQQRHRLSGNEEQTVREASRAILIGKDTKSAEYVAPNFAMLARDEDSDVISRLLNSESSRLRAEGVRSVLRCSHNVQTCFLPSVIRVLDDRRKYTRDLALYVIQRYKGEPASMGLPDEVFEEERKRIKEWWNARQ